MTIVNVYDTFLMRRLFLPAGLLSLAKLKPYLSAAQAVARLKPNLSAAEVDTCPQTWAKIAQEGYFEHLGFVDRRRGQSCARKFILGILDPVVCRHK